MGPKELAALKTDDASDTTKVLNLRKILTTVVTDQGAAKPFLLSIGERAEALATLYEDRQLTTQAALAEFQKLADEYVQSETERSKLGVDENTFAIYTILRTDHKSFEAKQAQQINAIFANFPDYRWNKEQESKLRTALYKALRPIVGTAKMIEAANSLLKLQRV